LRARYTIEASELLAPIDPRRPAGEDLGSGDLATLQQLAVAKQKQEFVNGTPVWTEIQPDWRDIEARAISILGRSKDLRAAVRLVQAAAAFRGLPDFAAALAVVRGLIETYWDDMYPVLEPDDEGRPDVMLRTSCLSYLSDRRTTIKLLRSAPLFSVRSFGPISLRTIELAEGRSTPRDDEEPFSAEELAAAFAEADHGDLDELRHAAVEAIGHAVAIETVFRRIASENRDPQHAIVLDPLKEVLEQIRSIAAEHGNSGGVEAPFPHTGTVPQPALDRAVDDAGATMPREAGMTVAILPAAPAPDGEIRSRADVLRMLDKICAYYADHEPSSPVPLLLVRARGLIDKNFIEILKELAPNGLPEAAGVFGSRAGPDDGS
jgi:type VI secretion system protein ImpA